MTMMMITMTGRAGTVGSCVKQDQEKKRKRVFQTIKKKKTNRVAYRPMTRSRMNTESVGGFG